MRSYTVSLIRGLAILGVVMVHTPQAFDGISQSVKELLSFGQLGCQAFFTMSAYCLCLSYSKTKISLFPFLKKRFMSMAPAYWSTILINIVIVLLSTWILGHKLLPMNTSPEYIGLNVLLLHGVLPLWQPFNSVVMGGWFVGTMTIFYVLFPYLLRIYEYIDSMFWRKNRFIIFPLTITILCWLTVIVTGLGQDSYCVLASAKYFYFVNQLPSFVLGIALYDVVHTRHVNYCVLKFLGIIVVTIILFYANLKYSHVICPALASLATCYLFVFIERIIENGYHGNKVLLFMSNLGDSSFSIYLSHFWIMFCVVELFRDYIGFEKISANVTITYFILLPFLLIASYFLSISYSKWINFMKAMFKRW